MDALIMTWFDIMKLQPNRTRSVPGSYKSSHKVDWSDKSVWSDFMDTISRFISDKEDIAHAIRVGNTIRTKPDITEHPIDSLGRWFGGPNRTAAYKELEEEIKREHSRIERIRQNLGAADYATMEAHMNRIVNKYLTTKGTSHEFTDYRRSAVLFGMMASGHGPRRKTVVKPNQFDLAMTLPRTSKPLRWMRSPKARYGLKQEMEYAITLLEKAPKRNKHPNKEPTFERLVDHIGGGDYCNDAIKKLVDRVFDFNKMMHPKTPLEWSGGQPSRPQSLTIKEYINNPETLRPIKELSKSSPILPDRYMEMFRRTHQKHIVNSSLYDDMWGAYSSWKYSSNPNMQVALYDSHKEILRPFRTRLLLIYIFHLVCSGQLSKEDFIKWVRQ